VILDPVGEVIFSMRVMVIIVTVVLMMTFVAVVFLVMTTVGCQMHGGMTGGSFMMAMMFVAMMFVSMERSCPYSRNGQQGEDNEKLRKIKG